MLRVLGFLVVLTAACESKVDKLDKALDKLEDKVDNNRVAKGLDKLDTDEAEQHLTSAREALSKGADPAEDCSWVARAGQGTDKTRDTVAQLDRLCRLELPLSRATKAVVAAEKAKAEQPEAPSLTECSSDEWAAAKKTLDAAFGGEATWKDLQARWTKVCGNAP